MTAGAKPGSCCPEMTLVYCCKHCGTIPTPPPAITDHIPDVGKKVTEGEEEWSKELDQMAFAGTLPFVEYDKPGNKLVNRFKLKEYIHKTLHAQAEEIFKDLDDTITVIHGGVRYDLYLAMKKKYLTKA